jgi:hypothetical protein
VFEWYGRWAAKTITTAELDVRQRFLKVTLD